MGTCGCGDFDDVRWAVRVGEYILAASDYDGCNNGCAAPLGFDIHLMTANGAAMWGVEPTGEWTPGEYGEDVQHLNLFSPDELAAAAREIEARENINLAEYDSLGDLLDDIGLDLMRAAWKRTRDREQELRARFGEKPPFAAEPTTEGEDQSR